MKRLCLGMALCLVSLGFVACAEKNCALDDTECIKQCIEDHCGIESEEMDMNDLIDFGLCAAEHQDICVDLEK